MDAGAPSARSLILDLLSTLRGGSMPVAALVDAGALFGLADGSVRVALTRLCSRGLVEHDERGRYRPGQAAAAVGQRVATWRRAQEEVKSWRGSWLAVHDASASLRARTRERRRHERALSLLGFRGFAPGLSLRPANLRAGALGVRRELIDLGLAEQAHVFEMSELSAEDDAAARALWPAAEIQARYAAHLRALRESSARLADASPADAMRESFVLGGAVLREIVLDPLLPPPIITAGALSELVTAMREYDRIGRAHWRAFLIDHGVNLRSAVPTPADLRETRFDRPEHRPADRRVSRQEALT